MVDAVEESAAAGQPASWDSHLPRVNRPKSERPVSCGSEKAISCCCLQDRLILRAGPCLHVQCVFTSMASEEGREGARLGSGDKSPFLSTLRTVTGRNFIGDL